MLLAYCAFCIFLNATLGTFTMKENTMDPDRTVPMKVQKQMREHMTIVVKGLNVNSLLKSFFASGNFCHLLVKIVQKNK